MFSSGILTAALRRTMGNHFSCVSCSQVKDKDNEPYKGTVSPPPGHTGDIKAAAAFSDVDIIDVDQSKSSLDHVHLQIQSDSSIQDNCSSHLVSQKQPNDSGSRISVLDIYNVLKENKRIKLDEVGEEEEEEEDDEMDDVEKAAKAIVDLSLFLTTKVIYPAYVRYLEQDHPQIYTQYYGSPPTPVPSGDDMSFDENEEDQSTQPNSPTNTLPPNKDYYG